MKVRIHSADIAYDDHGIGTPVIFLHAFPLNRSMWSGVMGALLQEQRYRLVALDWRGFGESSLHEGEPAISTMEMLADDLAGLMDRLGMERAVLCGLSMGGYVAFAFLKKYPERVRGLILADTRAKNDSVEVRASRENVAHIAETRGTEAIADMQVPKLLTEETRRQAPEVEARVRQMIAAATPGGIAAASRGMGGREDMSELLEKIVCPVQIIVGGQDSLTPPDEMQQWAEHITGARFARIEGAGHLVNLEQPEAFLEVVHAFLLTI